MRRFLLAVRSVHAAAAACDYLLERLGGGDGDEIVAVTVDEGSRARDGADAVNVVAARLGGVAALTRETRRGDAAEAVLEAAIDHDVDEVILGAWSGAPGDAPGLGSTAAAVAGGADRPVVVVPVDPLN